MSSNEWIIEAICAYIARYEDTHPEQAVAVERLGALPLWADWNGGVAIRPDGQLIRFYWDDPGSAKIETDPHLRFLAQVEGAEEYVQLAFLAPSRGPLDRNCPFCKGSGRIQELEEHGIDPRGIRCYCGGVGWLPYNVPDPPAYDFDEEGELKPIENNKHISDYLDYSGRDDVLSGGVKIVPVNTPKGTFHVWTKRVGNNPTTKMLLLHGGPGATHEYFEAFDSYFPAARIEYYYYDQLGSYYSDQPEEPELWELPRFVEEVEQVRQALGLDDFYLLGHSWGGLLATEYALKYQEHLKGLVISNMMSSIPAYNEYAQKTLMPAMDQNALAEIKSFEESGDHEIPRYMELLIEHHYVHHVLRMPHAEWPDPVNRAFKHLNPAIYVPMQGPSELGASGKIASWDRTAELETISIPTLVIGAQHDTMDPSFMEMMSQRLQKGRYLHCPQGSHLAMYDDQKVFFDGLIQFVRDVNAGDLFQ